MKYVECPECGEKKHLLKRYGICKECHIRKHNLNDYNVKELLKKEQQEHTKLKAKYTLLAKKNKKVLDEIRKLVKEFEN